MANTDWRPDRSTALPRVFYVRWWLFRLGVVAVVLSVGAGAMLPRPPVCSAIYHFPGYRGPVGNFYCDTSWHIGPRLAIAATGIVLALGLSFLGARLDGMVLRRRRARGRIRAAGYST
jgi:hypothetical protein